MKTVNLRSGAVRYALSALLLLVTLPSSAEAQDGCAGGYPDPAVSLRQSAFDVRPREVVWLGGRLSRNGCGLGNARLGLFVRSEPGAFRWVETVVTNARGEYSFSRTPRASFDAMVVFSGSSTQRRAISQIHHVVVTTTDDRDSYTYASCTNEPRTAPRSATPPGWQLELVGVPSRLRAGAGAAVKYRVTNGTDRTYTLSTGYNGAFRFVLLSDVRSGARPSGFTTTDFGRGESRRLGPGQSAEVPGQIHAYHCYYPRIHPGRFQTVGALGVSLKDEATGSQTSGTWYAPPVSVEVVG